MRRFLLVVVALALMSLTLLGWMVHKAGGFGPMLSAPGKFQTTGSFLHFFFIQLSLVFILHLSAFLFFSCSSSSSSTTSSSCHFTALHIVAQYKF